MPIEWMRSCDYFADSEPGGTDWLALDGDEIIGCVFQHLGGSEAGLWAWSMTLAMPGPPFEPRSGLAATRRDAARRVVQAHTALMARKHVARPS